MFVYKLGSQIDSLSVTLVVTLRKFLSLLISIFWFQNEFTLAHWFGAFLVFAGTLAFSDFGIRSSQSPKTPSKLKNGITHHTEKKIN